MARRFHVLRKSHINENRTAGEKIWFNWNSVSYPDDKVPFPTISPNSNATFSPTLICTYQEEKSISKPFQPCVWPERKECRKRVSICEGIQRRCSLLHSHLEDYITSVSCSLSNQVGQVNLQFPVDAQSHPPIVVIWVCRWIGNISRIWDWICLSLGFSEIVLKL
jgi:hypothetical protein